MKKGAAHLLEGFAPVSRLAATYGVSRQRVLELVKRHGDTVPTVDTGSALLVDASAFARLRASRATRRPMRSTWRDDMPAKE